MTRFLFLLIFVTVASTAFAQYPTVNNHRPRIYADSTRLNWLKENITSPGDCKTTYDDLKYAYENWWINDPELYLDGTDSTVWTWTWESQWAKDEAFLNIFIYKLQEESIALKRNRFLAQKIIDTINNADFSSMEFYPKEELLRKISDVGGMLLDWCYDDLPLTLRNELTQSLYKMNREFMDSYFYSSAGTSFVSSHNTWNTIFSTQNAMVLYNASGLTASQKDTVQIWYKDAYDKVIDNFLPCWTHYRDDDGGWNWGAAYSMWSLIDQYQMFENFLTGSNKNFYEDIDWLPQSINQYLYFIQPNGQTLHLGDGVMNLYGDRTIHLHARRFDDARSKYLSVYFGNPARTPNTMDKWNKLMYKDFSLVDAPFHDTSLDWWSDKVGLAVSRSSWDSSATMISFFNSPSKRAAHEHRDNNSLTIFKHKPLLVDAGFYDVYGGDHYKNYYERTIAHNTICVFDSTELYTTNGSLVSNDGGQIESIALQNYDEIFEAANQRGTWIKYAKGDDWNYFISDAQLSYNPEKLDFFRRKTFYLKPNKVIVLDNVHLKNTATNHRDISWIAHFVHQPSISGSMVANVVPGHIQSFSGNDYLAFNGEGQIAIRTLKPTSVTTKRIGGTGYEFWVNGVNYPPNFMPDTNYFSPGNWRIEVRPNEVVDSVIFLHTIQIGDDDVPAVNEGSLLEFENSIGVDWDDSIFFFSRNGAIDLNYHAFNNIEGNRNIDLIALDLETGNYDILVDGIVMANHNTDTTGMFYYSIDLPPGLHKVELSKNVTSIDPTIEDNFAIELYPNPTEGIVYIKNPQHHFITSIYATNKTGQKWKVEFNKDEMDISRLPAGIYLITITIEDGVINRKIIKH